MGGPNLEIFKFGMYIMFPIGFMYYFGTNLDSRFSVPDFWPKPEQTHKIPHEPEDIKNELERLKAQRLAARARRLELEAQEQSAEVTVNREEQARNPRPEILEATKMEVSDESREGASKSWSSWFR